ncbi:MAG: amino acid ABC transporter ATP-binding protein [Spirochaetaceae bacterium]|nr:amino acid ABC transporter ATP-binding protein [Spirochaetaceae bacterium]
MKNTILEVRSLAKSFGKVKVFEDISFSLDKGSVMALIGASGSGKTTLLRCLNFLEIPDRGQILVNGECLYDVEDFSTHHERDIRHKRLHFGLVFQNFNLFPQYTALRNVTLACELLATEDPDYRMNRSRIISDINSRARNLLDQVGLSDKLESYPHQLSGGQQQRVAIARALAMNPDILCFDEPTSALDPELTGEVLKVIKGLADMHTTMLIVTHEMSFARDVADNVIFMDSGSIVEQGPPSQVISNPKEARTRQFLDRYLE